MLKVKAIYFKNSHSVWSCSQQSVKSSFAPQEKNGALSIWSHSKPRQWHSIILFVLLGIADRCEPELDQKSYKSSKETPLTSKNDSTVCLVQYLKWLLFKFFGQPTFCSCGRNVLSQMKYWK